MHKNNYYRNNTPDFASLAEAFPLFGTFVKLNKKNGKASIDFRDPEALRQLTKCLLLRDFKLDIELPRDKLIPTVPSRLNYLCWIQDLVAEANSCSADGDKICGTDIGCGASAVYALLGAQTNGWHFIASEVDGLSCQNAKDNVQRNNLEHLIEVRHVSGDNVLMDAVKGSTGCIAFSMCNPPFYCDYSEVLATQLKHGGRPRPGTVSTASHSESVTEGGEVMFVKKMLAESKILGDKIIWYTSLLGKKANADEIEKHIRATEGVCAVRKTVLKQGKSHRWALAWSFSTKINPSADHAERAQSLDHCSGAVYQMFITPSINDGASLKAVDGSDSDIDKEDRGSTNHIARASQSIRLILGQLRVDFSCDAKADSAPFIGSAAQNTWSNWRRKRRQDERLAKVSATCTHAHVQRTAGQNPEHAQRSEGEEQVTCPMSLFEFRIDIVLAENHQDGSSRDGQLLVTSVCTKGDKDKLHQMLVHVKNRLDSRGDCKCSSVLSVKKTGGDEPRP